MKTAKVNVGKSMMTLPVKYLVQQTALSSVFDNVPIDSVDVSALIEANKHGGTWFYVGKVLHISVPTELIKWEE